ncbi:hypothetical protein BaRGS_00033463, partial [Batillaria attramentaria]
MSLTGKHNGLKYMYDEMSSSLSTVPVVCTSCSLVRKMRADAKLDAVNRGGLRRLAADLDTVNTGGFRHRQPRRTEAPLTQADLDTVNPGGFRHRQPRQTEAPLTQ